jgi:hypothetical protein
MALKQAFAGSAYAMRSHAPKDRPSGARISSQVERDAGGIEPAARRPCRCQSTAVSSNRTALGFVEAQLIGSRGLGG